MHEGTSLDLGDADGVALLATAREAIAAKLEGRAPRWPAATPALSLTRGAFVTIRASGAESGRVSPGRRLRGCIGRMQATESLSLVVREMAVAAAFDDPRFPPLGKKEYPDISIEVTVLTPMRSIASVEEIVIGRHGVYMTKGWHSAVFLPQVATEQGWNRDELLVNLCYKAGLSPNAWRDQDARFQVFEGLVFEE